MTSVTQVEPVEVEELVLTGRRHPRGGARSGRWHVVGLQAVGAVAAVALAALAPFCALFVSVTTTSSGPGLPGGGAVRFAFDGWGHPLTDRSADSVGFPFAGRGPSFGIETSACAALVVVAIVLALRLRRAGAVAGRVDPAYLAVAAGAGLLTLAGAMWLTVQPGAQAGAAMTRTTSLGPCAWLTAAAGLAAVLAGALHGQDRRGGGAG